MTTKFSIFNFQFSIFIVVIILLAIFLRFYSLSSVPPSASLDEVSIGWNAYSILQTGGDEYGIKFPLLLRAYDDFRPALYVYTVIPFVKLFGLEVLSVRLPSVILSIFSIVGVYFLVRELIFIHLGGAAQQHPRGGRMDSSGVKRVNIIAFFSSFLLTISPWHIYISRLGHETNLAFALSIFAIFFFLKFINTYKNIYIYGSSILLALSFYAYQAEKIFIPLMVIFLALIFRNELLIKKKQLLIAVALSLVILIPVLHETLSSNGLIRLKGTSAFDTNQSIYIQAAENRLVAKKDGDLLKELINNNRVVSLNIFAQNYISHFNPQWLFTNKLDDFKAPNVGLLYIWELPLILIGLFFLFSKNFEKKKRITILGWIIMSPVAASITTGSPHAMRAYNFLPTFQILSAIGLVFIYSIIKNDIVKKTFILCLSIIILGYTLYFFKQYFFVFPKEHSDSFQYALQGAVKFVVENEDKYDKVVFSNHGNLYQSYMFFLFGSVYDPRLYNEEGGSVSGGFAETHMFGKYIFRPIKWMDEMKDPNILYVGNVDDFPQNLDSIKTYDYLDEEIGVKIVKGG
jgi:4-amino-4-deoxy-L-arabinose transferase-like glycosyltransferase